MVSLLSRQGYAETSLVDVLATADAPRGSIYHYFRGGKDELVSAAITLTLDAALENLEGMRGLELPEFLARFAASWRGILERTECTGACAIMAVSVGADKPELKALAAKAFAEWEDRLADILHSAGIDAEDRARDVARYLLSAYEGAVLLGRAQHSLAVFDGVDEIIRSSVAAR
ncbi:TetR/AcrR family transcriptional regulator [Gordonia sp. L191]|uniref:TetR/AcrR family transcriptional regulator n=1 Tax=Gordonia sp. L191 TaxID=2982699 RepID=UPI0024BF9BD2|nr:TetR/AcrR family transcriptional regulator [Gordonia sp. L191]WHU47127.1 TetR/AcrR family transcriptional regulator [Gordonia sp. L191]